MLLVRYEKPGTVEDALALLAGGRWRVLAGGTDLYPAQGARPWSDDILDINALAELRGVSWNDTHLVIGARTSWAELAKAVLPSAFGALQEAAREVGSVQIQNGGTVGGNLCNASPAADGVPPLLVLDAGVELRSRGVRRVLPLREFLLGNRRTALRPDELLTAVRIAKPAIAGASAFSKLGARRYLVISIAMAAARLEMDQDGRARRAAVAVGACSAVAARLASLEAALAGAPLSEVGRIARQSPLPELSPIDDVRGSAAYRMEAAREIAARALEAAAGKVAEPRLAA